MFLIRSFQNAALGSSLFTIRLHHGRRITGDKYKSHCNGLVDHIAICDWEKFPLYDINLMLKKLGHKAPILYYYIYPTSDLSHGLKQLQTNENINEFLNWVTEYKVIEVYCNHLTEKEVKKLKLDQLLVFKYKKKNSLVLEEIVDDGGTKRPLVVGARANKLFFRKPIMYALEAPKHDDAELNDGASKNDVNVGASDIDVNSGPINKVLIVGPLRVVRSLRVV
ncbi:hypothetical protein ACH5RR_041348 [Cinchona calisaya]|uniref:PB1-like domain-containing protein n=1 Tax=Cinchona calisaya TaxID=153742 RepID=A0ABD2XV64_9GENT